MIKIEKKQSIELTLRELAQTWSTDTHKPPPRRPPSVVNSKQVVCRVVVLHLLGYMFTYLLDILIENIKISFPVTQK